MNDAPWHVIRRLEAREDKLEEELAEARAEATHARTERARVVEALGSIGRAAVIASGDMKDGVNAELTAARAEAEQLRDEVEKLKAPFRPALTRGPAELDRTPALVALPRNVLDFLATLVGGTGDFVWGEIAEHFELTADHVQDVYNILTAAAKPVAPGDEFPGEPGFVVGECGHRVAGQEWRVGFRVCERCPTPRCVSCGGDLVKRGGVWFHAGESCGSLIVPEALQ